MSDFWQNFWAGAALAACSCAAAGLGYSLYWVVRAAQAVVGSCGA